MKTERGAVIFRFNMVEVALALVILAIGLSSVLVLFPVGLKASRNSIADNNLGDIAERVAAYLQAKCSSSDVWGSDGSFTGLAIDTFDPEGNGTPKLDDFTNADDEDKDKTEVGMDGLFRLTKDNKTYYLYRQYSNVRDSGAGTGTDTGTSQSSAAKGRAVDFEAIVRVGWDDKTLWKQRYLKFGTGTWEQLKTSDGGYSRSAAEGITDPGATRMESDTDKLLNQFYRTLIIEISWPADEEWANREKRIFRVEMFNENFVPYPQSASGGGSGGSGSSTNP